MRLVYMAWRNLMRRKLRTWLTIFAIVIGVASSFSVIAAVDTAKKTVPLYLKAAFGKADFTISSTEAYFSDEILQKANQFANATAIAILKQSTKLHIQLDDISSFQKRVDLIGYSNRDTALTAFKLIDGDLSNDGAIITDRTAAIWKVKVGDILSIETDQGIKQIPVTGIVNYTMELMGPSSWMMAKYHPWSVVVPLSVVQEWFDLQGSIQEVQMKLINGSTATQLEEEVNKLIKEHEHIYMQPVIVELDTKSSDVNMFYTALYIAGFLGIALSAFVIFNSFYVSMRERKNEFAVLKTIGYTPNQLQRMTVAEVLMLSTVGTLGGLLLGVGLAYILKMIIFMLFNVYEEGEMQFTQGIIIATTAGLIVPLIAAIYPIRQACKSSVVEVLKEAPSESVLRYKWQGVAGTVLIIISFLISNALLIIPLLLGIILIYPFLFKLFVYMLKPLYRILLGFSGRVAVNNLERNLGRVSMTSVILCLGIAMIVLMSSLNSALIKTYEQVIDATYGGDLDIMFHHIEESDLAQLKQVDGVEDATTYRQISTVWELNGQKRKLPVYGVDAGWIDRFPLFTADGQKLSDVMNSLADNEVVMDKISYDIWGGQLGESIALNTLDGQRSFKVVGLVETMKNSGYSAFMNDDDFIRSFGAKYEKNALVMKEDDMNPLQLRENIFDAFGVRVMEMFGPEDWVSVIGSVYTGSFSIINFLIVLSIMISAIGITNTLMMNVMERVRELAMLRAIGVERKQLTRMVQFEGLGFGLAASIIGCMLGVWLILQTSAYFEISTLTYEFNISWNIVMYIAIFGIVLSLLASLMPATRASKIKLSEALRYE